MGENMQKFVLSALAGGLALSTAAFMTIDQAHARGKLCKAYHFHTWSASGPTKRAAQRAALRGWRSYTVFEYGKAWGNFKLAGNRALRCSGARGSWSCTATGRPCRLY